MTACTHGRLPTDARLIDATYNGQYGVVRQNLRDDVNQRVAKGSLGADVDRDYLLQRYRLMIATLADGYAPVNDPTVGRVYDLLRTAGLNKDKTVSSVLLNESLKIWKGEPFEQALAYHYVGVHMATQGSWDNTRAAVVNSLFALRDFGNNSSGKSKSTNEVVQSASDKELTGYVAEKSDFTLGYLMAGIANQQIANQSGDPDRRTEAEDYFKQVVKLNPALTGVVDTLRSGQYNTVLVVDFGRGPRKIATGPDGSIAAYMVMSDSDNRALRVTTPSTNAGFPWACDVNQMAVDHRWNNLEDMRKAKSFLGSALMIAGAGATAYGVHDRSAEAIGAGLGAIALGALMKATAHADTRYCEAMPQRVYVVPLTLTQANEPVTLQVEGVPGSRLTLAGLGPPSGRGAQLRYVRLLSTPGGAPEWAASGRVMYSNEFTGATNEPFFFDRPAGVTADGKPAAQQVVQFNGQLPYILGGNCVRPPTDEALASYQRSGFLLGMSTVELRNLYKEEGIVFDPREEGGEPGLHVLEGGRSMVTPLPGTLGFARLFGTRHGPYYPRGRAAQELAAQIRADLIAGRIRPSVSSTPGPSGRASAGLALSNTSARSTPRGDAPRASTGSVTIITHQP